MSENSLYLRRLRFLFLYLYSVDTCTAFPPPFHLHIIELTIRRDTENNPLNWSKAQGSVDDRLDRQCRQGHILTGLGKYIRRFLAQGYCD